MRCKKLLAVFTAAAMVFSMAACGGSKSGKDSSTSAFSGTQGTDMVTINITSEPMDLNPMRISDAISQSVLAHSMSGLTRLNEKDEAVADLAKSWDISEDDLVYTIHLREDAKWSNGDKVTANDFYYSWVTQMKQETGSIYAGYIYNNIQNGEAFYNGEAEESQLGLKVIDDYTLEVTWSHPITEANALFYLAQPFYLPINQSVYEKTGDDKYAKEADQMVTNGAYTITDWVHDDHLTMEKSDAYYDADNVKVPKVKLVMIGDSNTSLNALQAGELDAANLYSDQIKQAKDKDEEAIHTYIDGGSWYLNFNLQDPMMANANLRKALTYSIDIQSMLDNVIKDGSVPADGLVPQVVRGAGEESYTKARGSLFAYDKDAAKEYLEKALEELKITKENLKLELWIIDTAYDQNQSAYVQQQWKENLGIDVKLKTTSVKAQQDAKDTGAYQFVIDGWAPTENDAITFLENYQSENMNNTGKYLNPEYDKLIQDSIQESDPQKRQELLIQAEKMLMEEMVIGPLYFTCTTYAVSHKLEGLVRSPYQFFNLRYASIVSDK